MARHASCAARAAARVLVLLTAAVLVAPASLHAQAVRGTLLGNVTTINCRKTNGPPDGGPFAWSWCPLRFSR